MPNESPTSNLNGDAIGLPIAGSALSVSALDPRSAAVDEIGVISERMRGLATVRGAGIPPRLIAPRLRVDDRELELDSFEETLIASCWPRLEANIGELRVSITVVCAPKRPQLQYQISVRSNRELEALLAVDISVALAVLSVGTDRLLGHSLYCEVDPSKRRGLVEVVGAPDTIAAAFGVSETDAIMFVDGQRLPPQSTEALANVRPGDGTKPLALAFERQLKLSAGTQQELNLYAAIAPERHGARAALDSMCERPAGRLLAEAEQEARRLCMRLPSLPPSIESRIGERYRRNAMFCYNFSAAETIDTGAVVPLSSRSSKSQRCALVSEREILLWALPVITWLNPLRAREVFLSLCSRQARGNSDAVRYLDGRAITPGFMLDNLCAYPIALSRYITTTGDSGFAHHPVVATALDRVRLTLPDYRHRDQALYSTELGPSGRPAPYPFVTFSNVLAWRAYTDLGWIGAEHRHRDHAIAEEIRSAIYESLVGAEHGGFVQASDLLGGSASGDDPAGTLLWLPALGFCRNDDPVFDRTAAWLLSDKNPDRLAGPFPGNRLPKSDEAAAAAPLGPSLFCRHARQALQLLSDAPLDRGLLGGGYDPATGKIVDQHHHATTAGLIAWAVAESRELED